MKQFLSRRDSRGGECVVSTHASAGGGRIQIWNNNLFEFSMIPGPPDSRNAVNSLVTAMKAPNLADSTSSDECEAIRDSDIRAILPMLDYLIAEISRIDRISAHHLVTARTLLAEAVAHCVIRTH